MKTSNFVILVVALFALALWYGERAFRITTGGPMFGMPDPGSVRLTAAFELVANAIGVAVAAISALRLLQCAFQEAKLPQLLPVVVALFGGLLLYQRHWAIAVALAVVVVGWLIVGYLRLRLKKDDEDRSA